PPTVSITSPASGATVSGTINVTASASDNRGVADVQFFLDGAFGADDTTAPYSMPWDTTTASDGSHTLTAVARDTSGNQTTSAPVTVTVSNASPPPAAGKRYEETDPSVSFSGSWTRDTGGFAWSGGYAVYSMTAGAQATFTFTGTSVAWIGARGPEEGFAHVFIDGVFVSEVDTYARSYDVMQRNRDQLDRISRAGGRNRSRVPRWQLRWRARSVRFAAERPAHRLHIAAPGRREPYVDDRGDGPQERCFVRCPGLGGCVRGGEVGNALRRDGR